MRNRILFKNEQKSSVYWKTKNSSKKKWIFLKVLFAWWSWDKGSERKIPVKFNAGIYFTLNFQFQIFVTFSVEINFHREQPIIELGMVGTWV